MEQNRKSIKFAYRWLFCSYTLRKGRSKRFIADHKLPNERQQGTSTFTRRRSWMKCLRWIKLWSSTRDRGAPAVLRLQVDISRELNLRLALVLYNTLQGKRGRYAHRNAQ